METHMSGPLSSASRDGLHRRRYQIGRTRQSRVGARAGGTEPQKVARPFRNTPDTRGRD